MTNQNAPRRCSKRWLDGDCPSQILAIIDHGAKENDRFDVIYTDVSEVKYDDSPRTERWMLMFCLSVGGGTRYHYEMQAHEVAAYRYRMKHRYARWSDLPEAVKAAVHHDLERRIMHTRIPAGVIEVFDADAYKVNRPNADVATCGQCCRSWDDAHVSGWTPAPSGRCPFEYDHR